MSGRITCFSEAAAASNSCVCNLAIARHRGFMKHVPSADGRRMNIRHIQNVRCAGASKPTRFRSFLQTGPLTSGGTQATAHRQPKCITCFSIEPGTASSILLTRNETGYGTCAAKRGFANEISRRRSSVFIAQQDKRAPPDQQIALVIEARQSARTRDQWRSKGRKGNGF